ncbi:MAG: DUF5946 family protein, partial [Paracoccaceae bacterium]
YMSFSPACWARYGDILAREYSDAAYWRGPRLLTDAVCAQHSVGDERRARQSLHIHLAALMMFFEDDAPKARVVGFLRKAARGFAFGALKMPAANHLVSIAGIHGATDAARHDAAVKRYARAVFDAWQVHHRVFRALIGKVEG